LRASRALNFIFDKVEPFLDLKVRPWDLKNKI
jgi:hypothetical protein